jgi:hypothetical protein
MGSDPIKMASISFGSSLGMPLEQVRYGLAAPRSGREGPRKYAEYGKTVQEIRAQCRARGQTMITTKSGMSEWYHDVKDGLTMEPPCRDKMVGGRRRKTGGRRAPKRAMSAWQRFVHENYAHYHSALPEYTGAQIMGVLSDDYGGVNDLAALPSSQSAFQGVDMPKPSGWMPPGPQSSEWAQIDPQSSERVQFPTYQPSSWGSATAGPLSMGALGDVGIPEEVVNALAMSPALVAALNSDKALIDVVVRNPDIARQIAESPEMINAMTKDPSIIDEVINGTASTTSRDSAKSVEALFKALGITSSSQKPEDITKMASSMIANDGMPTAEEVQAAVSRGRSLGTPSFSF